MRPIEASPINVFNTKKVSHWNPDIRVPKFLLPPPKKWIFGPKTAKCGPKLAFLAKYRHFWPIWSDAWPKNNSNKLPRWFFRYMGAKTLTYFQKIIIFGPKTAKFGPKLAFLAKYQHFWPIRWKHVNKVRRWFCVRRAPLIRTFGPKTAKFGPKYVFLVILGQILVSLIHMVPHPTNKTMGTRCLSGFLICVYQNFCSFPKWLGCLAKKRPFLPQNMLSWAHMGLVGSFGALLVGWLVVVVRGLYLAPIYFMI